MDDLELENARLDAAYREKKDSNKPTMEGALKGGLASGLIARIVKPKLRRTEAALIGSGTTIGGALGKANHDNNMDKKRKAQKLLKTAVELGKLANPYEQQNNGMMGEVIAGAGLGAAGNALFAGKIPRAKWAGVGAITGGLAGAASSKVTDYLNKKQKNSDDNKAVSVASIGAAAGAIDGAVSPMVSRAVGTRAKKGGSMHKGVAAEIKDMGHRNPVSKALGADIDEKAFMSGVNKKKNERFFSRKALKTSGAGMARGALMGGALGYAVDRIGKYVQDKSNKH